MDSIVIELQSNCLDKDFPLVALVRKAYLIASKLEITEFKTWTRNELNGYTDNQQIPKYRETYCDIKAYNPYEGWIPFSIPEPNFEKNVRTVLTSQSIAEIEKLRHTHHEKGQLSVQLTGQQIAHLQKLMQSNFRIEKIVPITVMDKICESVRNIVLEWTIELEAQGILGNKLLFTHKEKVKAPSVQLNINNITNFQGTLGDIHNSEVQQNLNFSITKDNKEELKQILCNHHVDSSDIDELIEAIEIDPPPDASKHFGKKVSAWIGKMLNKAASGIWDTTIKTATNVLTTAINQYYGL